MAKNSTPFLSGKAYDTTKYIAQIFLPALGSLYFALSQIWGLAKGEEIVGTITVFDAFLGVLLGLSSVAYTRSGAKYDGTIDVVEDSDGVKQASLQLKNYENPADVVQQKEVTFKVTGDK